MKLGFPWGVPPEGLGVHALKPRAIARFRSPWWWFPAQKLPVDLKATSISGHQLPAASGHTLSHFLLFFRVPYPLGLSKASPSLSCTSRLPGAGVKGSLTQAPPSVPSLTTPKSPVQLLQPDNHTGVSGVSWGSPRPRALASGC